MIAGVIGKIMHGASLGRGLESTRALRKWVVLGLAIGVIAGFGQPFRRQICAEAEICAPFLPLQRRRS